MSASAADDDDGLFGDDEEEEVVVRSRGGGGGGPAEDEGLFGSDDDEANSRPGGADVGGDTSAEMDDLFGGDEGGRGMPDKAKPVAKRTDSKLRITKTEMLPETTRALYVRTSNVIKIQPAVFDPATYDSEKDKVDLGMMATGVRWRYKRDDDGNVIMGPDGKPEMESNARLVKLKTGEMQLIVGNNVYSCQNQDPGNSFLYMQKASIVDDDRRTALELLGPIDQRITLQPLSIHDSSRIMIGKVLKEEHKKVKRIETVKMQDDVMKTRPEDRMERLQKDEDDKIRQLKKQKGDGGGGYQQSRIRMSADYLNNADAEYDTMNLSDIKQRSTRSKKAARKNRDESEEDSDDDDDDEGEDLEGFIVKGDDDDEDEDDGPRYFRKDGKKKPAKRAKKADLEEPEEEEEEEEAEDEDEDEEDEDEEIDLDDEEEDKPKSKKEKRAEKPAASKSSPAPPAPPVREAPETDDHDGDASADPAPRRKKMVIDDDDE